MSLFSICIPTYEMGEYGNEMLEKLFENLKQQTVQDFELVISDQSQDLKVFNVCKKYSSVFTIKYVKNFYGIGKSAHNLNTCLDFAVGKIIKVMFMDDYFLDSDALKKISNNGNLIQIAEKVKNMSPEERRAFFQRMRERREAQGQ
jgi:glycosyltransferase involved in cell wall biosynthesis